MEDINSKIDEINTLISEKDFVNAKKIILQCLEHSPEDTETLKLLGLCHINLNEYQKAKENFEKVIELNPDDALSHFYLGSIYELINETDKAEAAYLAVIKLREDYVDAYKNLGVVYLKKQEFAKTIKYAQKALQLRDDDYQIYFILSSATLALKEFETTIKLLEEAIKLNPKYSQLYHNLGNCHIGLKDYDKALESFQKALELEPNNSSSNFMLGTIYQIKLDFKGAYTYFQKAYQLDNNPFYLSTVAFCAMKIGEYQDAITYYGVLSLLQPEKDNFKYNLANCYEATSQYDKAITILEQLFGMNAKNNIIGEKLANLYHLNGSLMKAKELYQHIIKKGKVSAEVYYQYAIICSQTNDVDKAVEILKKVIVLNPKDAYARKDLAILYLKQGLLDWAKDEFETAYKLDKTNLQIIFEYANYKHVMQDYGGAKKLYNKALKLGLENKSLNKFMGKNYLAMNDIKNAEKYLKLAIRQDPQDTLTLFELGKVFFTKKEFELAKQCLLDAYSVTQDIETANFLGTIFMNLKEYMQAKKMFLKVINKHDKNANLFVELAKAEIELGELGDAKEHLNKALEIFPDFDNALELLAKIS